MNAYCTIHNAQMAERQSKTKFNDDGSAKTYFSHLANGTMCFGKGMGNGDSTPPVAQPMAKKHDTMLICNAMNNAQALVSNGIIPIESLEQKFNEILAMLESKA